MPDLTIPEETTYNSVLNKMLNTEIDRHRKERDKFIQLHSRYTGKYFPYEHEQEAKSRQNPHKYFESIFLDYVHQIVDSRNGYFTSNVTFDSRPDKSWPVQYATEQQNLLKDYITRNHTPYQTQKIGRDCGLYGVGYKLLYIDSVDNQVKTMKLKPEEVIWYDDSQLDKPQTVMRYYKVWIEEEERWYVELYDDTTVYYLLENGRGQFQADTVFQSRPMQPHGFSQIPIVRIKNNEDMLNNVNGVIDIIDELMKLLSDFASDYRGFANAIMAFVNAGFDSEQMENIRTYSAVVLENPSQTPDMKFITKDIKHEPLNWYISELKQMIHKFSRTVDFAELGSGYRNLAEIKLRLLNMENDCSVTEEEMKQSLMKEFQLANEVLTKQGKGLELDNVYIEFKRNIPVHLLEELQAVQTGRGLVSKQTLLSQLSFIDDPDKELELLRQEQEDQFYNEDVDDIITDRNEDSSTRA